jgi:hypothetical protein
MCYNNYSYEIISKEWHLSFQYFSLIGNEIDPAQPKPGFFAALRSLLCAEIRVSGFVNQEFDLFYDERVPNVICTCSLSLHWNTSYVSQ